MTISDLFISRRTENTICWIHFFQNSISFSRGRHIKKENRYGQFRCNTEKISISFLLPKRKTALFSDRDCQTNLRIGISVYQVSLSICKSCIQLHIILFITIRVKTTIDSLSIYQIADVVCYLMLVLLLLLRACVYVFNSN